MRDQLSQEVIDGNEASRILNSSAYQKAWETAELSILAQMAEVKMRDVEMHTRLIMALQTLTSVRNQLKIMLETGKLADIQLKEPSKISRVFGR